MRTPIEEQLTSVLQRQRKKATLHWLLYRSIDGEKPELCRYKCMFLGLGILFLLFSGVLFAQVAVPAIQKRNKTIEIEVPKEEIAEMPQTEVPTVEAQVKAIESDTKFGVIATHFIDPIGDAISAIDMPKIPEVVGNGIVAVNTGDTVPEESIKEGNIEELNFGSSRYVSNVSLLN